MNPDEPHILLLLLSLLVMLVMSAYFSSSETAMMAVNRYRLRHLAKEGHQGARRTQRLLRRPDRLLGVILIGNNLVNFSAAAMGTVLGLRLLGDLGVALAPVLMTLIFLIFAEVAPKTLAAQRPEGIAFPSSMVLSPLLRLLYPVVWLVNAAGNLVVRPFVGNAGAQSHDKLNAEEIRTLVRENVSLPSVRQNMLLGILDLEKANVNDIMVPRGDIVGIDVEDPIEDTLELLANSEHTRLPVFRENINDIIGILHLRRAVRLLKLNTVTIDDVVAQTRDPYFVLEGTPLSTQLLNFQRQKRRIALVVDEYGDVQGIVTLEDILEEIVGEFTTDLAANDEDITPLPDGRHRIDGMAVLRDINRHLQWNLPISGPRTLNGLLLDRLGVLPDGDVCLTIDGYRVETQGITDNRVNAAVLEALPETAEDEDLD